MKITPHNLREYVCTNCREINLLRDGEDETKRPCDDCRKIGTLVPIQDAPLLAGETRKK